MAFKLKYQVLIVFCTAENWSQRQRNLPSSVSSASSLLVYDTDINAFRSEDKGSPIRQQQIKIQSTNGSGHYRNGGTHNDGTADLGIAAAPDSLASSNHGDISDGGGLLYVPELANLPEFEMLPDFLDLPNIAFDESYASTGRGSF